MTKKKTVKKKVVKKSPNRKTSTKKKKRSASKTRTKEIVRVKTFIVEKPVYVEAPSRFQRLKEKIPSYSGNESRYSKQKEEKYQEAPMQEDTFENENYDEPLDEAVEEPLDESVGEPMEDPMAESFDETGEESQDVKSHIRSRGLFKNIWWKKGLLKGFFLWILIVIFVYILDLFGMAEVVDAKKWIFFLVLLLIFGMGYQKYISGKVDF
ncbi:MAG: hypothetical protein HON47_02465 [Candidatus Diapherotrites archaeon]|jgi:hypothetical protein|uniref:Uncharacterized protein n=1 Tax=Candidatus Iainarchaeum sp. TaxID=3101447 RepID=A0A8T5GEL3_9ARCH|nr:hypothetical protein [Candidatus Diapherotrites archaeon]MBT7241297.1 hypothetical protein [Candidatus Diapherotrites archaeon]